MSQIDTPSKMIWFTPWCNYKKRFPYSNTPSAASRMLTREMLDHAMNVMAGRSSWGTVQFAENWWGEPLRPYILEVRARSVFEFTPTAETGLFRARWETEHNPNMTWWNPGV